MCNSAVSFKKRARAGSPSADRRERTLTYVTEGGAMADELLRRLLEETGVAEAKKSILIFHCRLVNFERLFSAEKGGY